MQIHFEYGKTPAHRNLIVGYYEDEDGRIDVGRAVQLDQYFWSVDVFVTGDRITASSWAEAKRALVENC